MNELEIRKVIKEMFVETGLVDKNYKFQYETPNEDCLGIIELLFSSICHNLNLNHKCNNSTFYSLRKIFDTYITRYNLKK